MTPILLATDGANPLGFLATLGATCLLTDDTHPEREGALEVRLHWTAARNPVLTAEGLNDGTALVQRLAKLARRPAVDDAKANQEKQARADFENARQKERNKRTEIKKRRLPRDARNKAFEAEHVPLARQAASLRTQWLAVLANATPDRAVSMALDLSVTPDEFSEHCHDALGAATLRSRRWVDLCASFGVGGAGKRMEATPFALISGSGRQWFLDTAGKLMVECSVEHIRRALFGPWLPEDETCSFRWDPDDDRRYALLADDPTASNNKPKTLWGANRLAFEALRLFPCVRGRSGPATAGWRHDGDSEVWRWPLWSCDLSPAVIPSLIASEIWRDDPESRRRLRGRGVFTVFQTRRIVVGKAPTQKLNFAPAVPIW